MAPGSRKTLSFACALQSQEQPSDRFANLKAATRESEGTRPVGRGCPHPFWGFGFAHLTV